MAFWLTAGAPKTCRDISRVSLRPREQWDSIENVRKHNILWVSKTAFHQEECLRSTRFSAFPLEEYQRNSWCTDSSGMGNHRKPLAIPLARRQPVRVATAFHLDSPRGKADLGRSIPGGTQVVFLVECQGEGWGNGFPPGGIPGVYQEEVDHCG